MQKLFLKEIIYTINSIIIVLLFTTSCYQNDNTLKSPYPNSENFNFISFNIGSHKKMAIGSDIWGITWSKDGDQYAIWGDGGGFFGDNKKCRVNLGVSRIEGESDNYSGFDVFGNVSDDCKAVCESKGERWGFNLISIDNVIYKFTETHKSGAELFFSKNLGCTWTSAEWKLGQNNEDSFSRAVFLNMGKNYEDSRDEYVYIYAPEKGTPWDSSRNKIELARVKKDKITERNEYQFFSGLTDSGKAKWDYNIEHRRAVFEWPRKVSWLVSPSYNQHFKKILIMFNSVDPKSNKTQLAVFEAENPWGPWYQIQVLGNLEKFGYTFSFWLAPKWWKNNGTEFTLVFSGTGKSDSWNTIDGKLIMKQ